MNPLPRAFAVKCPILKLLSFMYTENDIETAVIKHFYSQQKIAFLNIKCLYLKMSGYFFNEVKCCRLTIPLTLLLMQKQKA